MLPSWLQRLFDAMKRTGPWVEFPTRRTNVWGDACFQEQVAGCSLSQHAMRVFDTDASSVRVRRSISGTIVDSEYACGAILSGPVGARYGTFLVSRLTAPAGTHGSRTTVHTLPSGPKRVFVIGGAQSGSIGQHVQNVSFPAGSNVFEVPEPVTGTLVLDGSGSRRFATDGFVVSGGVLSSQAHHVRLRMFYTSRVARLGPTEVFCAVGTNTLSDGVTAADYKTALGAWVTSTRQGAPDARIVVMSILRRSALLERTHAAAYRVAAREVCLEQGLTYVDGLSVLAPGDLSADQIHPRRFAQEKLAAVVLANTSATHRTMLYVDSILSGSCDPQYGTGYTGPVHLIRSARS